ncbi:RidA family protein [Baekduia soli]|nr:RidA family protein [Baekduia soli]
MTIQQHPAGESTTATPVAQGAYWRVGGFVFTNTHHGTGPDGALVAPDDCERQLEQALANLGRTLRAAGSAPERVVKIVYYVRDAAELPDHARLAWFVDCWPESSVVELRTLAPGVRVEIEAVATLEAA